MIWDEIVINKDVADTTILDGFQIVFQVKKNEIVIVVDESELSNNNETKIGIVKRKLGGQFCLKLSIYLCLDKLDFEDKINILKKLIKILNVECLASDQELNPYSMYHIKNDVVEKVFVKSSELDNKNEYWLE